MTEINYTAEAETGQCIAQIRQTEPDGPHTIDAQMTWLYDTQRTAEADAIADAGQAMIDAGGWVEICRAVLGLAPAWVTDAAKREYLRCNGLDDRRT